MKLLKKIFPRRTKTSNRPEGVCDRCQITIWQGDKAICFHTDTENLYLCEACIETVYGENVKAWIE